MLSQIRIGFAMCGSFCTFERAIKALDALKEAGADITPILSEAAANTDTRFGECAHWRKKVEDICGKKALCSIEQVEPIGPKKLLDVLVIAPATGNTMAKIANGISDSAVSLAAKAHLRNERPVVIAPSSNDALGANAQNIGKLLCRKYIYFVPFGQDDAQNKHSSLVAHMDLTVRAVEEALLGRQIQPILS